MDVGSWSMGCHCGVGRGVGPWAMACPPAPFLPLYPMGRPARRGAPRALVVRDPIALFPGRSRPCVSRTTTRDHTGPRQARENMSFPDIRTARAPGWTPYTKVIGSRYAGRQVRSLTTARASRPRGGRCADGREARGTGRSSAQVILAPAWPVARHRDNVAAVYQLRTCGS